MVHHVVTTTSGRTWRAKLAEFIESGRIQYTVIALIVINAITLGFETAPGIMEAAGGVIAALDHIILSVFVVEIALRITAHGWRFFRDPWSLFDFIVVAIALIPASGPFAVLRALRILRVLRLLTMVPQMRRVISALLSAIPGLSSIIVVLLLVYYVFAVIATNLFAQDFPQWFGTIARSMYSLFQIMTLESWSMGIVRPVMEVYPYAWMFFIPFILVATFTMLNLFIAIIVSAMQTQSHEEHERTQAAVEHAAQDVNVHVHRDVQAIQTELRELRRLLEQQTAIKTPSRP